MTVYRISRAVYAANDGQGALLHGGRWNPKGYAVIYTCESRALCALEVLANSSGLPAGMAIVEISIPAAIEIARVEEFGPLPEGWAGPTPSEVTRSIGRNWIVAGSRAVLSVPSSVIPLERNYLLNPQHPEFREIRFGNPTAFVFDARLK